MAYFLGIHIEPMIFYHPNLDKAGFASKPEPNKGSTTSLIFLYKKQEFIRLGPNLDEPEPNKGSTTSLIFLYKKQEFIRLGPNTPNHNQLTSVKQKCPPLYER
jgi:hypothetical protein